MAARTMVSLRLDPELVEWADGYAKQRGVTRTVLLETALEDFREDCKSGVPDLRRNLRAVRANEAAARAAAPKPNRGDFDRAVADRSELFKGLAAPESVRFGVKRGEGK